jgi:hypothetical protein
LFQALLSDSDELAKSFTYKFSEPWLGSSLLLAEGTLTASVGGTDIVQWVTVCYGLSL